MIRKVQKAKIIEKDRFIVEMPVDVEVTVVKGDKVKEGTLLYTQVVSEVIETHYLPKSLGVRAANSSNYIGRVSGQLIEKGDLLAEKIAGAGLITKRIVAGTDGIISTKRIKLGYIDILDEASENEVTSPVEGVVTGITLGKRIEIESSSVAVDYLAANHLNKAAHHVDSLSGEHVVGGRVVSLVSRVNSYKIDKKQKESEKNDDFNYPEQGARDIAIDVALVENSKKHPTKSSKDAIELTMNLDINNLDFRNKIVYVGNYLYPEMAKRLYKKEAVAVITNAMDYTDFDDLDIPIIVLNGFGPQSGRENFSFETVLNEAMSVDKSLFVELSVESKQMHVFGLTEDILESLELETTEVSASKKNPQQTSTFGDVSAEIKVGDYVKSLEPESFGMSGRIAEIQDAAETGESGTQILIVVRENGSHFITDALTVEIVI
jgi:hypothetical protein